MRLIFGNQRRRSNVQSKRYILQESFPRNDGCGMFRILFKVSTSQIAFTSGIGKIACCWEICPVNQPVLDESHQIRRAQDRPQK